jgi:hypothetical protein
MRVAVRDGALIVTNEQLCRQRIAVVVGHA